MARYGTKNSSTGRWSALQPPGKQPSRLRYSTVAIPLTWEMTMKEARKVWARGSEPTDAAGTCAAASSQIIPAVLPAAATEL
jgi:hypothetical protein